jgi:hypothetical protein
MTCRRLPHIDMDHVGFIDPSNSPAFLAAEYERRAVAKQDGVPAESGPSVLQDGAI